MTGGLLEVHDLAAHFEIGGPPIRAVDGVSFSVAPGEIVGLVGESGCGKSVTALCILRLLRPPGRIVRGKIVLDGVDLLELGPEAMRRVRGRQISIVVQNALAALNPVIPVGEQVADVLLSHDMSGNRRDARDRAIELLGQVGIPDPARRGKSYAHELSGGMQQRVVIAAALAGNPRLIIADEPTTALDVTVQQQILALMKSAAAQSGSAVLFISHDLATVSRFCDRVLIMYAGRIVESTSTEALFAGPLHPYTEGLLASIPPLGGQPLDVLPAIPGQPPDPRQSLAGCRFAPRCGYAHDACLGTEPELREAAPAHLVRCVLHRSAVAVSSRG